MQNPNIMRFLSLLLSCYSFDFIPNHCAGEGELDETEATS